MQVVRPRMRSRALTFTLRGLIAGVLLIAIALAWIINGARVQAVAVNAITCAGGSALYGVSPFGGLHHSWRDQVDAKIGPHFFRTVTYVGGFADSAEPPDEHVLSHISQLHHLHTLNLFGSTVTDARVGHLSSSPSIKQVLLQHTEVGDDGLRFLDNMRNLQTLVMASRRITDKGLVHLRALRTLAR